jgi:hypothetical protein
VYVIYLLDKEASIKIIDVNNNINIYKLKLTQSATGIELDWDDAPRFFQKVRNGKYRSIFCLL